MTTKIQVIALISGGKDSFFSILHCLRNGHNIVALANLFPEDEAIDDTDSYMYQTVGHAIIPLYAEAVGIPLYRAPITGGAVNTDRIYHYNPSRLPANDPSHSLETRLQTTTSDPVPILGNGTDEPSSSERPFIPDETEALLPLLTHILTQHPHANAISTGAILSTYQRTRIESIATRLNLIPLSYLWQVPSLPPYTQTSLLHDIGAVYQDSRIIKTASGTLGKKHLWASVGDAHVVGDLVKDLSRFGGELEEGAVLGEGGEYETITLDGPAPLWRGKIEVEESGKEVVAGQGGSWTLRITGAKVVRKEDVGQHEEELRGLPRMPPIYDDEFAQVLESMRRDESQNRALSAPATPRVMHDRLPTVRSLSHDIFGSISAPGNIINITNLHGTPTTPIKNQMKRICKHLRNRLHTHNLTPDSLTSTTILLRHMSDFVALNAIYGELFTLPTPPARITVACGEMLDPGMDVMLSAVAVSARREGEINSDGDGGTDQGGVRRGLHVQSRSYWAPANIGPYSQAIAIPLIPPLLIQQQHATSAFESINETTQDTNGYDDASNTSSQDKQPAVSLVYIAGQIPLLPSSMDFVPGDFAANAVLALQHLWRVGRAMDVRWWGGGGIAFVVADQDGDNADGMGLRERVKVAAQVWQRIHAEYSGEAGAEGDAEDEEEDVDIAEQSLRNPWANRGMNGGGRTVSVKTRRARLPNYEGVRAINMEGKQQTSSRGIAPHCFIVQIDELPRGADIEWTSFGLSGQALELTVHQGDGYSVCEAEIGADATFRVTYVDVHTLREMQLFCERFEDGTIYRSPRGKLGGLLEVYTAHRECLSLEILAHTDVMWVSCRSVWNANGEELYAGIRHRGYFSK